jgi:hypothetical protein
MVRRAQMHYAASRRFNFPAEEVFEIATVPVNMFWIKGFFDPRVLSGDGCSPGTTIRSESLAGEEFDFEIIQRADGIFRFRGMCEHGLLEGQLTIRAIDDESCEVEWAQGNRPSHPVERLLVALSGPLGRRASVRDAQVELARLEQVVQWVRRGRKGPPFAAGFVN